MKHFKAFEKNTKDGGFEKACKYLFEKLGYDCELTKSSGDDGVDIILTNDNTIIGVQCKNYDDSVKISNDRIRDFRGALNIYNITNGIFMSTTGYTSEAIKTANKLGIELWDYTKIKSESHKLGFDLETLKPKKLPPLKSVVFPHNKEAYSKMEQMLTTTNKCLLSMGMNVGKTTTALEYCIQNKCRALVVCPSTIIKDGWKYNKSNQDDRLLDTITYQALSRIYKDLNYNTYGLVICDEVHHAGAETWGTAIKYLMNNGIKVLGLTATEERTDGNNVAETLFDGNMVEGLDILQAIKQDVLYSFTYVGALYNAEQVCQAAKDKYGDKLNDILLGEIDMALNNTQDVRDIIKKNMPKGNRKGIIFSADIDSMDTDMKFIQDIYPTAEIKKLHSNMSYKEQNDVKEWFEKTKAGYICTVGMVNEGAHYEGTNTIFMLRKTSSELVFLQQLGRALTSKYGHKDPHTVVFDLVNSSKAIQNVKRKFREAELENTIKVSEEDYQKIEEAIFNGDIKNLESEEDIIELATEDLAILKEETGIELNIEEPKQNIPQLTRTIYIKTNPKYSSDYGKSKQIIMKDYTKDIVEVLESLKQLFDLTHWGSNEINTLKTNWETLGEEVYTLLPGRTAGACRSMASVLGISTRSHWIQKELDILLDKQIGFEAIGLEVQKFLPLKSIDAIKSKATKLNLHSNKKPGEWCNKRVRCIETGEIFESIKVASISLGLNGAAVGHAIAKNCKSGGYHWAYEEEYQKNPELYRLDFLNRKKDYYHPCMKKIRCIETGVLYNSVTEAIGNTGAKSINCALIGKCKTAGGYHWEYVEEEN